MSKFDTAELNDIRSLLADLQSQQDAAIGKSAPKAEPAPQKAEAPKAEPAPAPVVPAVEIPVVEIPVVKMPEVKEEEPKKSRFVFHKVDLKKVPAEEPVSDETVIMQPVTDETVKLDAVPKAAPKKVAPVDDLPVVEFPVVEMPKVEPVKKAEPKPEAAQAEHEGFNLDKILTDISDVVDETVKDPTRSAEMLKAEKAARRQIVPEGPVVSPGPEIDRAPVEDPKPLTRKPILLQRVEGSQDVVNMAVIVPKEEGVISVSEDR